MRSLICRLRESDGAAATEFALVAPTLIFLIIGLINAFMYMYSETNMHSSTEWAARYAAVTYASTGAFATNTAVCAQQSGKYVGPTITSRSCSYTQATTCGTASTASSSNTSVGHVVTLTANFPFYYGFGTLSAPLKATACYS